MADKLQFTFLGTSSAIPTERRNHTCMLLQYKGENIMIDCGEGTQRQIRKAKLSASKINTILITHWHGDHTLGLPGLLQSLMLNNVKEKITIHGPVGSREEFQKYYALLANRHIRLDIEVIEHRSGTVLEHEDFTIECLPMNHSVPVLGYAFTFKEKTRIDKKKLEALKLPNSPLIGQLVQGKTVTYNGKKIDGKKLLYTEPQRKLTVIMDTKLCDNMAKLAKDSDVFIVESSYLSEDEEKAEAHFHMTAKQGAEVAKKAKVAKLILTHPTQKYDLIPKALIKDAQSVFKNVEVAEDFMSFEL